MAAPDLIKTIDEFEAEYRKGIGELLRDTVLNSPES